MAGPSGAPRGESSSPTPISSNSGLLSNENPLALGRNFLSKEFHRGFIDGHPVIDLQGVTQWTLIYDPESENFFVVNGVRRSLALHVEDGAASLPERVRMLARFPN
ncbi:uncharacterized protein G2W53_007482 [Senna tora]|uniref:Uncharacterized protein n=1 Tax=Senna tora TaxID=362788 RepID=A0A834X6V9_9FABA|nr:uncharacterized protein G2W53_007482 [Senna tora]